MEIASRLRRELDDKAITISAGRTLAPNVFDVLLSDEDFDRAQDWGTPLAEELCDVVIRTRAQPGLHPSGPGPDLLPARRAQREGHFEITSSTEKSTSGAAASRLPPPARVPAAPEPRSPHASSLSWISTDNAIR